MPIPSAVDLLAATPSGSVVAVGLSERIVEIWNLQTGQRVAELSTILDFGGNRLALSSDETVCITGAWTAGIAAYKIPSRELLWHRRDIKHVQEVAVSSDASHVYCGLEERKLLVLDIHSGQTANTLPVVRRLVDTPFSNETLLVTSRDRHSHLVKGDVEFEIEHLSFAVLDAKFGPKSLCVSEARGPVRCFDLQTGNQLWRFDPETGTHVGRLGYRVETDCFYGVLWNYEEGGPRVLLEFANGVRKRLGSLGDAWAAQFCMDGNALITSNGQLFNTADGSIIRTLNFPQRRITEATN